MNHVTTPAAARAAKNVLRAQYRDMIQAHILKLGTILGQNRIDYSMFDTSRPLDDALFTYLSNRQRMMRVR